MTGSGPHTIHKEHIHHGWNNAFPPRPRIAPGETGFVRIHPASWDAWNGRWGVTLTQVFAPPLTPAATTSRSDQRSPVTPV